MTALTNAQLDELERKAKAATTGPWRFGDWSAEFGTCENPDRMLVLERNLTHSGAEPYVGGRADGRHQVLRLAEPVEDVANAQHIAANSPDVTLRLVAIARAALAWSEAHDELQGAHYMAVAGGDPEPARKRYRQEIAALQKALGGAP